MSEVPPASIPIALEKCDTTSFEKYAQTVFGAVIGNKFKPLGGMKDGGADGFVEDDVLEDTVKQETIFQASKEIDTKGKIKRTVEALRKYGRDPKTLLYATSRNVKDIDKLQNQTSELHGLTVRIYDAAFFEQRANYNGDVQAAFFQYLQPSIAFLEKALAPSYPSIPVLPNAQVVSAFLSQEVERRIGISKTLESVTDALILWALEETDPNKSKFLTIDEIIKRVELAIPTAKQFFRGAVEARLKALTKKTEGTRSVNVYGKSGKYCLPYDSREILKQHAIEDESLRVAVSSSFEQRITKGTDKPIDTATTDKLVAVLHRVLESVFETQGLEASRHFLNDDVTTDNALPDRHMYEIAEEEMAKVQLSAEKNADLFLVIKTVLRGIFYSSTKEERAFCSRLARTYILLFTIRNTPEVINYFNTMSKHLTLYVGSDLLVRAISEFYLPEDDQMTVNALKIIRQAGSKLVLTEQMLEEVHSHIHGTNLEYVNHYQEIDGYVDALLASQSSKILIRAYYYAKLDDQKAGRPKNWGQFLNNFLTPGKLTGPVSEATLRELKDTVCRRYGLEFESRADQKNHIDADEAKTLASRISAVRGPRKREVLSENDAEMLLRIEAERRKEKYAGNPYGFKTWYLTQDSISNIAFAYCFKKRRTSKFVMRPEFLLNYIAYNPTDESVRQSLKVIFPSVLGVRLGSRMTPHTITNVLNKIEEAHSVDPARATSIVSELSDALKSNHVREFAIKYGGGQ